MNQATYGAYNEEGLATGYFYLSYYDKSLAENRESFEFSSNLNGADQFYVSQYDYLPAGNGYYALSQDTTMSTANVFTVDADSTLMSVSTRTESGNTRLTYSIYLLNENAQDPTDGTCLYKRSKNLQYGGFHRIDLDKPILLHEGDWISVVCTGSVVRDDGSLSYEISATQSKTLEAATAAEKRSGGKRVINPGESFLFYTKEGTTDAAWYDWSEEITEAEAAASKEEEIDVQIDNFSIKAYYVPLEEELIDLTAPAITGLKDKVWTGEAITQDKLTVVMYGETLTEGIDYLVSYENNISAGTATVIITGEGKYTGSASATFQIKAKPISETKISLSKTTLTYSGSAQKPTVTVKDGSSKLKKDTDYTIKYTNNKNVGTATVTVTGIGNYTGTKKVTFKIIPKGTKISSATALSKAFTVKWKKQTTQTTGYQIQYSTKKDFSSDKHSSTISKNTTASKKVNNLKSKKRYYVRVRTYKTVNGMKYYSAWSAAYSVKTK